MNEFYFTLNQNPYGQCTYIYLRIAFDIVYIKQKWRVESVIPLRIAKMFTSHEQQSFFERIISILFDKFIDNFQEKRIGYKNFLFSIDFSPEIQSSFSKTYPHPASQSESILLESEMKILCVFLRFTSYSFGFYSKKHVTIIIKQFIEPVSGPVG